MTSGGDDATVVTRHDQRGIAHLTLDSQANRNALSRPLTDQLARHLGAVTEDATVRAVVLTHAGTTFCAGADLAESATEGGPEAGTGRLVDLLRTMLEVPKPLIARIDGAVRGGGLGLVAACDLAVATEPSTFAFTEARLGVAPAVISLTVLDRLDDRAASRWFLTGDRFDGTQAAAMGLVTAACGDTAQMDHLLERWCDSIRRCAPQGLAASKELLTEDLLATFDQRAALLAARSAELFASDDAREGIAAFRERRRPRWATD